MIMIQSNSQESKPLKVLGTYILGNGFSAKFDICVYAYNTGNCLASVRAGKKRVSPRMKRRPQFLYDNFGYDMSSAYGEIRSASEIVQNQTLGIFLKKKNV